MDYQPWGVRLAGLSLYLCAVLVPVTLLLDLLGVGHLGYFSMYSPGDRGYGLLLIQVVVIALAALISAVYLSFTVVAVWLARQAGRAGPSASNGVWLSAGLMWLLCGCSALFVLDDYGPRSDLGPSPAWLITARITARIALLLAITTAAVLLSTRAARSRP